MTHQEMLPSKMKILIVDLLSLKLTNGVLPAFLMANRITRFEIAALHAGAMDIRPCIVLISHRPAKADVRDRSPRAVRPV